MPLHKLIGNKVTSILLDKAAKEYAVGLDAETLFGPWAKAVVGMDALKPLADCLCEAFMLKTMHDIDGDLLPKVFHVFWRDHQQGLLDAMPEVAVDAMTQRLAERNSIVSTEGLKQPNSAKSGTKLRAESKTEALPAAQELVQRLLQFGQPPMGVLAINVTATVGDLGPKRMQHQQLVQQVKDLTDGLGCLPGNVDMSTKTEMEARLATKQQECRLARQAVELAEGQLDHAMNETANAIMHQVMADKEAYDKGLRQMIDEDPSKWQEFLALTEEMANKGPLAVGDEVMVSSGKEMKKAKVLRCMPSDDCYLVSVWKEITTYHQRYEEGFETRAPIHLALPRHKLFKRDKVMQKLPSEMEEHAKVIAQKLGVAALKPNCIQYLLLLYAAAQTARDHLLQLNRRIMAELNGVKGDSVRGIVPPLKGMQRAIAKTLEKYKGDFRHLSDLARMTFECKNVSDALEVLKSLMKDEGFQFLAMKNRLREEFDVSETGGYRDVLMNFYSVQTEHIVEVQLSFVPLLAIKQSGGHASYVLNRTLGLLKKTNIMYSGILAKGMLQKVRCGRIQEVQLRGQCHLDTHLAALVAAIQDKKSLVKVLDIAEADWPAGQSCKKLMCALVERGAQLERLRVSTMGDMAGELPEQLFIALPLLKFLSLSFTGIGGVLSSSLGMATSLKSLYMGSMQWQGTIPKEMGNMCNLEELQLSNNQLSGSIPPELGQLSNLQKLSLFQNQLSGSIPPELGQLSNLQKLYLSQNQLSGSIPPELGQLSNLQELYLSQNQLSGSIPPELGQLSNLQKLYLYQNQLSGSIPHELGQLSNLQELSLFQNQLSGSIPPELGQLSNLQEVYLYQNQLSGSIPPELGQLSNLQKLSLCQNQLSGSIPPELGQLSNLQKMSLFQNQLSGSIPPELGQLSNLQELSLSQNQLSGSIPPELGQLSNLQKLSLSQNQLSGSIPPELRHATCLVDLLMHSNRLSGECPLPLTQLPHLKQFAISGNQLRPLESSVVRAMRDRGCQIWV